MFRYYAVAALIVVTIGAVLVARRLTLHDFEVRSTAAVPPRPQAAETSGTPRPGPFSAEGPWVLSALTDCFDQQAWRSGPAGHLDRPPAATRIGAGTTFRAGACTVTVRAHDVLVMRRGDRLRVTPEAALYRAGGELILDTVSGPREDVRRYHVL